MAGFTGITIGRVQMNFVMLPIQAITKQKTKQVDLKGHAFMHLITSSMQPDFTPDDAKADMALITPRPGLEDKCSNPLEEYSMPVELKSVLGPNDEVRRLECDHLSNYFPKNQIPTSLKESVKGGKLGFIEDGSFVTQTMKIGGSSDSSGQVILQMVPSGPRKYLHHDPSEVAAAIITCGGLCPGLNTVIREVVLSLSAYGVKKVYGIKGGYKGVVQPETWITLTPETVRDIHTEGGTILVCDRGNPTEEEQAPHLIHKGIKAYFIIGGDGTHLGAMDMYELLRSMGHECSVIGIPKSIDNDIPLLDRTFGFDTAMTEAGNAIDTAYTESKCNANCIGLVKLMGRHCGLLTMMAVVAARHVDVCLIPEMNISLTKVLEECVQLMKDKGSAVIVVAEGCGETLMKGYEEYDAGGNKIIPDVGIWLKDTILSHFKKIQAPLTIKYVDPTYMVRAVRPSANDSIYCAQLARGAVHAAMAGYSGVTVARIDDRLVYLPIKVLCSQPAKTVDTTGRWFERLIFSTQQSNLEEGGAAVRPRPKNSRLTLRLGEKGNASKADVLWVPDTKIMVYDGYGKLEMTRALERGDLLRDVDHLRDLKCQNLCDMYGSALIPTPLKTATECTPQDEHSWVTQSFHSTGDESFSGQFYYRMIRAGPRQWLYFDPCDPASSAAIVSCGGICPGLNCVIRELVMTLWAYGVRKIWGIIGGYKGVMEPENWIRLTPEKVRDIHLDGGTMLVSDRGNPLHIEMAKVLKKMKVRQYFVLGGDGTHKGIMQTFDELPGIGHECAMVGVPKTIDNDVPLLDQTFGFDTAMTEAVRAVNSAYVEATCNANAIGLVKLMGRHCGFIAMYAALAARCVDICLIPEMSITTDLVLAHALKVMRTKGYCVIVVAEGCGDTMISSDGSTDAGGNKLLADIGPWLKKEIEKYFKENGQALTIKYNDPTYMIRSIPANAYDNAYCSALAQSAVHGAMAGYTGITVGKMYERHVYLPIHAITQQPGRRVNTSGRWFQRLKETTQQPDFASSRTTHSNASRGGRSIMEKLSLPSSINNVLQMSDEIRRLQCVSLKQIFQSAEFPSPLSEGFVAEDAWHTQTFSRKDRHDDNGHVYHQMLSCGPRETLFADPSKGKAVIVTCGGLCPGLNSVIRELVLTLKRYGIPKIYGCIGGYKSMVTPEKWVELNEEDIQNIHRKGGTVLVSDRGNPPHCEIAATLKAQRVTNYFVIGGDGTHAGAMDTFTETQKISYPCTVVGVPKTIDNDIVVIDRTFGFNTACTEAVKAINSAYTEAISGVNALSLVRLMGRSCGFIAMEATVAARHVDICLIPEMDIALPKVLTHATEIMDRQGHCVIVVAEGCGDTLIKSSGEVDEGGNKKLADVGPWLRDQLEAHFMKMQRRFIINYIDPTYTIRAVPPNPNDSIYCSVLGQHAVHGAMAGYSGITVGKVDERYVMIPIHAIARKSRKISLSSRHFERLIQTTGQKNLAPGEGDEWKLMRPQYPNIEPLPKLVWEKLPDPGAKWWKGVPKDPALGAPNPLDDKVEATLKVFSGIGEIMKEEPLEMDEIHGSMGVTREMRTLNLSTKFGDKKVPSPLIGRIANFLDAGSWAMEAICNSGPETGKYFWTLARAGPREQLHFNPAEKDFSAAILSLGSICPGTNVVLRELFMSLTREYGSSRVFGIPGGFMGILERGQWIELNADMVFDVHNLGGTWLKSTGGHPLPMAAASALQEQGIRQVYLLGGDGTQKYATHLNEALMELEHECAVVGIPCTVDSDIPKSDRCPGFDTAMTEAKVSIDAAYVEATCNANCIGLVNLAGHRSGNLALQATLASCRVDICLLPEMEIQLDKLLDYCEQLMDKKGYAVIVVTEGCTKSFLGDDGSVVKCSKAGPFVKDRIMSRFKEKNKVLTIKYIDPTAMILTVKANSADSVYCTTLAQHAVHGAMAGYTGCTVVKINERYCYMPTLLVNRIQPKRVDLSGTWFGRMIFATKQADFSSVSFSKRQSQAPDRSTTDIQFPNQNIEDISAPLPFSSALIRGCEIHRLDVIKLWKDSKTLDNPTLEAGLIKMEEDSYMTRTFYKRNLADTKARHYLQLVRSGPREKIHFDPKTPGACAAIVTAGGLCPGLNTVIREVVRMLHAYGVEKVWGIRGGYKGCVKDEEWVELTDEYVQDIHTQGGTVLVSDRGNPPHIEIAKTLQRRNVRWYFVLGGDGTHKGATQTYDEMPGIGHECAVCGVPKTIDNDIQLLDQTFGFDTAVMEAERAIDSAYCEATTNANCIGLVKLMGRHCGWVAATAALAARHVDICLIPEMELSIEKVLAHMAAVMRQKKYCVIVIAEGCGDTLIKSDDSERDAGGNKKLADVGIWLKDEVLKHCKKERIPATLKYIDPTYMIRSVEANAFDNMYCSVLGQEAVHGAMAGYTCFTVGKVDEVYCMIPIHAICGKGPKPIEINSRVYDRLIMTTQQPDFKP
jgi:6-phosphofructokinase 1